MTYEGWKLTVGNQGVNMNDNAKKWVKALRSKEFKQCNGQLKKGDGYCCLGGSCVLYAKENNENWEKDDNGNDMLLKEAYVLPTDVMNWLGLNCLQGIYGKIKGHPRKSLADDNDGGKTFSEIADIIESEPEGLFKD